MLEKMALDGAIWQSLLDAHIANLTNHHTMLKQLSSNGAVHAGSRLITEAQLSLMSSRVVEMLADTEKVRAMVGISALDASTTGDGHGEREPRSASIPLAEGISRTPIVVPPNVSNKSPINGEATQPVSIGYRHTSGSNPSSFMDLQPIFVNLGALHGKTGARYAFTIRDQPPATARAKGKSLEDTAASMSADATRLRVGGAFSPGVAPPTIEYEDVSAEVDARLEKRQATKSQNRRRSRRRKRESAASLELAADGAEESPMASRPKKRPKKTFTRDEGSAVEPPIRKFSAADNAIPVPGSTANLSTKRRLTNGSDVAGINTAGRRKRRKATS